MISHDKIQETIQEVFDEHYKSLQATSDIKWPESVMEWQIASRGVSAVRQVAMRLHVTLYEPGAKRPEKPEAIQVTDQNIQTALQDEFNHHQQALFNTGREPWPESQMDWYIAVSGVSAVQQVVERLEVTLFEYTPS